MREGLVKGMCGLFVGWRSDLDSATLSSAVIGRDGVRVRGLHGFRRVRKGIPAVEQVEKAVDDIGAEGPDAGGNCGKHAGNASRGLEMRDMRPLQFFELGRALETAPRGETARRCDDCVVGVDLHYNIVAR